MCKKFLFDKKLSFTQNHSQKILFECEYVIEENLTQIKLLHHVLAYILMYLLIRISLVRSSYCYNENKDIDLTFGQTGIHLL